MTKSMTKTTQKTQTTFERFEYKYWVTDAVADRLLELTAQHLRCDDFAPGGQRNTSLYLDSPDLRCFRAHVESAPERFKLRVRAYGDPPPVDPDTPAFFEIKRKVKDVIFKNRAVVPLGAVAPLLRGEMVPGLVLKTREEERTLEQFLYFMITSRAEPKVLLTCRRQAFTSIDRSEDVRMTLDRDVCYQPACGPVLQGRPQAWTRLCGVGSYEATAATLIELKFRGAAPLWIADLLQRLKLVRSSFSKYVAAIQHLELGPEGVDGSGSLDRIQRAARSRATAARAA